MSYVSLFGSNKGTNYIIVVKTVIWDILCIDVGKKECAPIDFMLDYFERWMDLSGNPSQGFLNSLFQSIMRNSNPDRNTMRAVLLQMDKYSDTPNRGLRYVNYPVLEPINRLLFDFKEAERKGNKKRMYQLTEEWRDMGLTAVTSPKGPLNRQKFYAYTGAHRKSIFALICVVKCKRAGRDVKNLLLDSIFIE